MTTPTAVCEGGKARIVGVEYRTGWLYWLIDLSAVRPMAWSSAENELLQWAKG